MSWTLGEFLFWLVLAIFVPAIVVHFTLGRNGGHRLFEKDGLTPEEIRDLPFKMLRRRLERQSRSGLAILIGMSVALVVYPLGRWVGLPVNIFGISDQVLFWLIAGAVAVLVLVVWRRTPGSGV